MNTITKAITQNLDNIYKSTYLSTKNLLIFDIETTGFSRENEIIYMIGCICKTDGVYSYYNIFAENPGQEPQVIESFFNLLKDIECVIHYNGNRFDIPFLLARANKHHIKDQISHIESIDLYDIIRPLRGSLRFPDLKLDTIQKQLGYKRKDLYSGGELIQIYHNYTHKPDKAYYQLLLLHNQEDVEGMLSLLPLIDIMCLIDNIITSGEIKFLDKAEDKNKLKIVYELAHKGLMDLKLFSTCNSQLVLTKNSNMIELLLPLQEDEKKFFFENYKDYMYILENDQVMHKTIANFIPANKKRKANKAECYVSQIGSFIPAFLSSFKTNHKVRIFKDDLKSKNQYVMVSSELNIDFYIQQIRGFLKKSKGIK